MRYMVWVPLLLSVVVAGGAPAFARALPHRMRPAGLTGVAVVSAAGWLWSWALLAASLAERLPSAAHQLHTSAAARSADLPPAAVGACALVAVAGALLAALVASIRLARELARAERLVRGLPAGRVHVIAQALPDAFAVGGVSGGRVVITTGMLACLDDDERRAVLAHERAHLAGRHHWLRMVVACCAAVDPLLRHLPELVETACERWADERAARASGQRTVLARALGKAALASLRSADAGSAGPDSACSGSPASGAMMPTTGPFACGFGRGGVPERMSALLAGPPHAPRAPGGILLVSAGVTALVIGAGIHASTDLLALLR